MTRPQSAARTAAGAAASAIISTALEKALVFVKAKRSWVKETLPSNIQRSDFVLAQALVLQQNGNSRTPCPTCGFGCSTNAVSCRSCKRLSHIYCNDSATCVLCSSTAASDGASLLRSFIESTSSFTYEQTFDAVERFIEAGPSRRRLRLLNGQGRPAGHATVFLAAVRALLDLAFTNQSAELLLFYLPRVLAIKGLAPTEAIHAYSNNYPPKIRDAASFPPTQQWRSAIDSALESGKLRALIGTLDRGPAERSSTLPRDVDLFYPKLEHEAEELSSWNDIVKRAPTTPRFSTRDLKRWANANPSASGAECGWTGHLVLMIAHSDSELFKAFTNWAARPPTAWAHPGTGEIACRALTGWFIPSKDSVRPISAPSFVRRVGSATLMRKARPFLERYTRTRGQLGLSDNASQLAYSTMQQAYLASGGSVALDDRSKSFVHINRTSVQRAFADVFRHATDDDSDAMDALAMALTDYYISDMTSADSPQHHRLSTVNFKELPEMKHIYGLAQGCSTSPSIQAVVLAYHVGQPPPLRATSLPPLLTLGCHDDLARSALAGFHNDMTAPSCDAIGGTYNFNKSVIIGNAAPHRLSATMWGRPLGDSAEWFSDKMEQLRNRLYRIRTLSAISPSSAIRTAVALGGPRGLLLHALKGLPPNEIHHINLLPIEQAWADLIVDMCGTREPPWDQPQHRFEHVFASPSLFFQSSVETICLSGFLSALDGIAKILNSDVAECAFQLLASDYCTRAKLQPSMEAVRAQATLLAQRDQTEWNKRPSNLWISSLAKPTELTFATSRSRRRAALENEDFDVQDLAAKLALAHSIRFPFRIAASVFPLSCPRCFPLHPDPPRMSDDLYHLQACKFNTNSWRHDALVRDIVRITQTAGVSTEVHDETLPCLVSGKRPADFIERSSIPAQPDFCIDLTIAMPEHLLTRCASKHRAYDPILRSTRFTCNVFGISLDGTVHDETLQILQRWTTQYAALRKACFLSQEDAHRQLEREIAHAFTITHAAAIRRWQLHIANLAIANSPTRRPLLRPKPVKRPRTRPCKTTHDSPPALSHTPTIPCANISPPAKPSNLAYPDLSNPPIPYEGVGSATPTLMPPRVQARSIASKSMASDPVGNSRRSRLPPHQRHTSSSSETSEPAPRWPAHLRARIAVPSFLRPSSDDDNQHPGPMAPTPSRGNSCFAHQTPQHVAAVTRSLTNTTPHNDNVNASHTSHATTEIPTPHTTKHNKHRHR